MVFSNLANIIVSMLHAKACLISNIKFWWNRVSKGLQPPWNHASKGFLKGFFVYGHYVLIILELNKCYGHSFHLLSFVSLFGVFAVCKTRSCHAINSFLSRLLWCLFVWNPVFVNKSLVYLCLARAIRIDQVLPVKRTFWVVSLSAQRESSRWKTTTTCDISAGSQMWQAFLLTGWRRGCHNHIYQEPYFYQITNHF